MTARHGHNVPKPGARTAFSAAVVALASSTGRTLYDDDHQGLMRSRPQPSSIAGRRRRNRIAGQFTALLTDILESPAWRVLSLSAHRVLDQIAIELRHHGDGATGCA